VSAAEGVCAGARDTGESAARACRSGIVRGSDHLVEPARYLIVNADDFGYSRGVNRGIIEAHERGIVTSASLMVKQRAAGEAAAYARHRSQLSLGLHVELGRWRLRRLPWARSPEAEARLRGTIAADVRRQLDRFRRLVDGDPTHLDSHQHRHRHEPVRSIVLELANELAVPLREFDERVRFCGDFYGQIDGRPWPQGILPDALIDLLESLPSGVTELCSHPGYADDLKDWYKRERAREVRTLCDPAVHAAIDRLEIRLATFRDLALLG
jgi:chitin disaccharide deacetylase